MRRMNVPVKLCAAKGCKMPMFRLRRPCGKLETPKEYSARKTCNRECMAVFTRKVLVAARRATLACLHCETPIHRKRFPGGVMEATALLRRRKFCDAECAYLYADERGLKARFINKWRHERNQEALR